MYNYKSIGRCVSVLNRYSNMYFSEALSDFNIHGSGQLRIVLTLAKHKNGITQDELANDMLVDKGSVSRMIRPLIENGIVTRQKNPEDQRAYVISLTGEASQRLPEIRKKAEQWTRILSKGLSGKELDTLFILFEKLEKNAETHIRGPHHD